MSRKLVSFDFNKAATMSKEELRQGIADIEALLKESTDQIEIPIKEYFSSGGSGVYAREMTVPSDALLVGKIHKFENMNILSKGEVSVLSIDGVMRVKAPFTFVSQPGAKRVIFAHEEAVWTTILGTNEKDTDIIEENFIATSYDELGNPEKEGAKCLS